MAKKMYPMGTWCTFGMAAALIANGVATFTGPNWLWDASRILIPVFGLGMLPAVLNMIPPALAGWATWVTNLAYLGLVAEAIRYLGQIEFNTTPLLFGGLGVWGITMNVLALRHGLWPRLLAWIGIASSVLLLSVLLILIVPSLDVLGRISAAIGAVGLYPVWLIWQGLRIRQEK